MELNLGVLADSANVDANGKLYILGEFRYIMAAAVPAQHGRLAVVARFVADTVEVRGRENNIEVEMVDVDGQVAMPRSPKIPLKFSPVGPADRGKAQAQVILNMEGLLLPKYGDYAIHFIVNDRHTGKVVFHVTSAPPPTLVPDVNG